MYIATKMPSDVEDGGESVEGGLVEKLDFIKQRLLRTDAPVSADECAAMQGGDVLRCVGNKVRV